MKTRKPFPKQAFEAFMKQARTNWERRKAREIRELYYSETEGRRWRNPNKVRLY